MKKILDNKILNTIISIIEGIICVFLFCLVVITLFQRVKGSFFDYRIYTVASESMIPNYNVGDVLLVSKVDLKDIKVGDAVTYIGEATSIKDMIITHRVEKIEKDKGIYYFHTKGIANNIEDPIVEGKQIIGKVTYKFRSLSFIGRITTDPFKIFFFVTVPIAFLIAVEIIKTIRDKDDEDDEEDIPIRKKINIIEEPKQQEEEKKEDEKQLEPTSDEQVEENKDIND